MIIKMHVLIKRSYLFIKLLNKNTLCYIAVNNFMNKL